MSAAISREVLEARIEQERAALADTLQELRAETRRRFDVRLRVVERPAAWLGGALLVGFLMGVRR